MIQKFQEFVSINESKNNNKLYKMVEEWIGGINHLSPAEDPNSISMTLIHKRFKGRDRKDFSASMLKSYKSNLNAMRSVLNTHATGFRDANLSDEELSSLIDQYLDSPEYKEDRQKQLDYIKNNKK